MFGDSYKNDGTAGDAAEGGHKRVVATAKSLVPQAASPTADAAGGSGADANGQPQAPHTVKDIIKTLDEEQDVSGPKGGCCSRIFVPFVVAAMIIIIFGAIVYTNGTGSDVEAAPRVAVIVMEGFSGTIFHALMQSGVHLPNIAAMLSTQKGVWAECATASQSSCARAVVVENDTSGEVYISAAAAATSIFSGVSPRAHQVSNGTLQGMSMYATTSKVYPSFAKRVRDAGKRVAVMASSHVLNSLNIATGGCSEPGVLDMECAASQADILASGIDEFSGNVHLDCLASSTCNANSRIVKTATNHMQCSDGHAEAQYSRQLNSLFGGLAYTAPTQKMAVQNTVADNLDDSLFVFHWDALAVRAASPYLPEFRYNVSSQEYIAQAYLLDAMVGQVISYVRDRSRSQKENWLVIGLADHGGSDKSFSTPVSLSTSEDAIPFFMATYTSNSKGFITLAALERPVTQVDVLPTVLTWLNVAPYDGETNKVVNGKNTTAASPKVEAQVAERKMLEGLVQGICGSGMSLTDCAT
ncbi:hypothetical protein ABB37_08282 [Leptomonas pyrrhocoris]|uniref:Sulfatase N-terminal domain-containing protein n=1 Tax=Leptomonas pyrrhocoris TaxID=157538 RepID=A0A0M9FTK1_LEPPY|nr:hypothetical protein ABB37_08282 [Leptomonas pyrrhocoris]KPA75743.1 hypothetical protein ABB37_08282 [Leptomonas pyrrhocoris]|eukprot:XP_015654182.1 hypothetical protein ABB37_08282 [Leptomonas pyrrhocoris]